MSAPSATPEAPASGRKDVSPAVRNAVRLCLSAKEYRALYDLLAKRAPALKGKLSPALRDDPDSSRNRHTVAALRASLRVFVGTGVSMKLVELILSRITGKAEQ